MHRVESFDADLVVDLHLKIDEWLKLNPTFQVVQIVNIPKSDKDLDPTVSNYQVLVVYNN
ncbi:hypothetical protein [Acinetobacter rudis]|uniref:Uncharacterized protein n=1 Tax=Acinetobacter rudis TaxID=632955 RepID=A0AAW8JBZ6_9GAMM|nr:hypothetical protein [Acinetobacter rudis]MDQ8937027.1 hypothetical protein [Acinetobacter rudis]MDQ9019232.1 hypothetical protein [Acinetobacter rudis]